MNISQCLIVKNEEKNIEKCLGHLKGVVNEQIVVDTGSTDSTIDLARKMGAKVFEFEWVDDFSAARNFAIGKAKGDWIIFLDCDEYFSDESIPKLKNHIKKVDKSKNIDGILSEMINITEDGTVLSVLKNISSRIYRNKRSIRYHGSIHETLQTIETKNKALRVVDASEDLRIMHTGYDPNIVAAHKKSERNTNLLKKELDSNPDDELLNFYYAESLLLDMSNKDEAIMYFKKAIKCAPGKFEGIKQMCYDHILELMAADSEWNDEMVSVYNEAVKLDDTYPDFYVRLGDAISQKKNAEQAIQFYDKAIECCVAYNKSFQSHAVANMASVYNKILLCSITIGDKVRIVKTASLLLQYERYNYENLYCLMKTLLTSEKESDIFEFLKKFYDYNRFKDKAILTKCAIECGNGILESMYKNLMTNEEIRAAEKSNVIQSNFNNVLNFEDMINMNSEFVDINL